MCTHNLRVEISSSSCPLAAASLEWRRHQSLDVDRAWANWDSLNKIHILACHYCSSLSSYFTPGVHLYFKDILRRLPTKGGTSCEIHSKVKHTQQHVCTVVGWTYRTNSAISLITCSQSENRLQLNLVFVCFAGILLLIQEAGRTSSELDLHKSVWSDKTPPPLRKLICMQDKPQRGLWFVLKGPGLYL